MLTEVFSFYNAFDDFKGKIFNQSSGINFKARKLILPFGRG